MPLRQALQIAWEKGLDLVEVAPQASPPVCRLLNYSKFKYEQAKKEKQARKRQKTELSEVRMYARIKPHDMKFKIRQIEKLLKRGSKVKVRVNFRGREIIYSQLGHDLLNTVLQSLDEVKVEKPPTMEGKSLSLLLSPAKRSKV